MRVNCLDGCPHPKQITLRLDDFQSAISTVQIHGTVEAETSDSTSVSAGNKSSINLNLESRATLGLSSSQEISVNGALSARSKASGTKALHLDFGGIQTAFTGLIEILGIPRLWIMIDEWSEVPIELQPYLADFIRRTVLPTRRCVVKIAAIEHRSNLIIRQKQGAYVGLELGADITANLNLDDFLVFDADEQRSINFFKALIFRHYSKSEHYNPDVRFPDDLIHAVFTQYNVFSEFVSAVEGVPRDALNLAAVVATKGYGNKITMAHVREGARDWYQRDKAAVIRSNKQLSEVLSNVISEVIGKRKARAFMLPNGLDNSAIEELFDARLLHILKKNVSAKDEPGARYDVLKIDYGCYVDLKNTNSEPKGLFEIDDGEFVEVPRDDYRSIRRAILTPEMLAIWTRNEVLGETR